MKNVKFVFNKIAYTLPKDMEGLAIQVDKYSYNMAKKIVSTRHLPYEYADELHGEFNLLFFDKVVPKISTIDCDVATYFNSACQYCIGGILKSKTKKRSKGLADYDSDSQWCSKYTIHTTGSLDDQSDKED